jgi:hypothetical protein
MPRGTAGLVDGLAHGKDYVGWTEGGLAYRITIYFKRAFRMAPERRRLV